MFMPEHWTSARRWHPASLARPNMGSAQIRSLIRCPHTLDSALDCWTGVHDQHHTARPCLADAGFTTLLHTKRQKEELPACSHRGGSSGRAAYCNLL